MNHSDSWAVLPVAVKHRLKGDNFINKRFHFFFVLRP